MLEQHVSEALRESGRRIVITGASGWLGRATLDLLRDSLGNEFEQRVRCFGSQARALDLGDGHSIGQRPLAELASLPNTPSLVLHLAFLTKDRAEAMAEAEYREAVGRISATVLGALDSIGSDAVFVASSGAAAFADDPNASPAMRLYGELKRDDEQAFAAWAEHTGKTAVIARIFNLSGPHINKLGSYALACFILDALAGRPISVRARHEVRRGHVAIRELMSLVFAMFLEANAGATLFETGGQPLEMGEIAKAVASELGSCAVERDPPAPDHADLYLGDHAAYQALLRRYGVEPVPFGQQVAETAQFIANKQEFRTLAGVATGGRPC